MLQVSRNTIDGLKNKEGCFGVFCYINKVHFVEAFAMLTSAK